MVIGNRNRNYLLHRKSMSKITITSITITILIMLFSNVTKALSIVSPRQSISGIVRQTSLSRNHIVRYMTSSTEKNGESVVSTCREKIMKALETDNVVVTGAYDDPNGSHISIQVVSPLFAGKRPVQRQQLVYKAIWEELAGPVHAVDSMICKTPTEN